MTLRRVALLACAGASVHRTVATQRVGGRSGSSCAVRRRRCESNRRPGRRRGGGRPSRPSAIPSLSHRPHRRFLAHRLLTRPTLGAHADRFVQARRRQPVRFPGLRRRGHERDCPRTARVRHSPRSPAPPASQSATLTLDTSTTYASWSEMRPSPPKAGCRSVALTSQYLGMATWSMLRRPSI